MTARVFKDPRYHA